MNKKIVFTLTMVLFTINSIFPSRLHAENVSISLSPPVLSINASRATPAETHITLKNHSNSTQSIEISIVEVQASAADSSTIKLSTYSLLSISNKSLFNSIALTSENKPLEPQITLDPNEQKTIKLSISPIETLQEKDYYFAVIATVSEEAIEKIQLKTSTSSIVLLSTGPQETTSIDITRFETETFSTEGPKKFQAEIINNSGQHESIYAEIKITNMFGQLVEIINLPNQYILADSQKVLLTYQSSDTPTDNQQIIWDEKFIFGPYKATLLVHADGENITDRTIHFVGLPVVPGTVVIFILVMASGIYLRVKRKI